MNKFLLVIFSILCFANCKNKSAHDDKFVQQIQIKDYSKLGDTNNFDTLVSKFNCPDEDDSLLDDRIKILKDSVVDLYNQLIVRMEKLSKANKYKQYSIPFLESLNLSKEAFLQTIDADSDLFFYSFGKATASGSEARCLKLYMLQERLLLLKSVFENSYWNYEFNIIK